MLLISQLKAPLAQSRECVGTSCSLPVEADLAITSRTCWEKSLLGLSITKLQSLARIQVLRVFSTKGYIHEFERIARKHKWTIDHHPTREKLDQTLPSSSHKRRMQYYPPLYHLLLPPPSPPRLIGPPITAAPGTTRTGVAATTTGGALRRPIELASIPPSMAPPNPAAALATIGLGPATPSEMEKNAFRVSLGSGCEGEPEGNRAYLRTRTGTKKRLAVAVAAAAAAVVAGLAAVAAAVAAAGSAAPDSIAQTVLVPFRDSGSQPPPATAH